MRSVLNGLDQTGLIEILGQMSLTSIKEAAKNGTGVIIKQNGNTGMFAASFPQ